jgi:ribosomal protein S18 acetylase RimI-like enzyme
VEELSQFQATKSSSEIADLVIRVFFVEEAELKSSTTSPSSGGGPISPWKAMQCAYLKNLQNGDIKGKKFLLSRNVNNSMFVARAIVPCYDYVQPDERVNVNGNVNLNGYDDDDDDEPFTKLYNLEYLTTDTDTFKKGPILGFVDVSEKTFGLASDLAVVQYDDDDNDNDENTNNNSNVDDSPLLKARSLRPVLTNLSVKEEARKSGVGSALVEACETIVTPSSASWSTKYNEMVLEVEGENELAQRFYEKRGYVKIFADPSARRYDTSGFVLKEVRTTKIAYRKVLKGASRSGGASNGGLGGLFDFFKSVIGGGGAK